MNKNNCENELTRKDKILIILVIVWAILMIFFGLMCGLSVFTFDKEDLQWVSAIVSILLGLISKEQFKKDK